MLGFFLLLSLSVFAHIIKLEENPNLLPSFSSLYHTAFSVFTFHGRLVTDVISQSLKERMVMPTSETGRVLEELRSDIARKGKKI